MFFQRTSQILMLGSSRRSVHTSSSSLTLGIHVFQCPDTVGIVAKLSECIASHGGNIHGVDVYAPQNRDVFNSRSEFVYDSARWPRDAMNNDFLSLAKYFNAERSIIRVPDLDPKYKIAVLASKQVSMTSFSFGLPTYYVIAASEASSNLSRYDDARYGKQVDVDVDELNSLHGDSRITQWRM